MFGSYYIATQCFVLCTRQANGIYISNISSHIYISNFQKKFPENANENRLSDKGFKQSVFSMYGMVVPCIAVRSLYYFLKLLLYKTHL